MPAIPLELMDTQLGRFYVTRSAASRLHQKDAMKCLERHMIGDYGDIDDVDWKTNDAARAYDFPVVSSYLDRRMNRFLIITEPDRAATTIMLPEEY